MVHKNILITGGAGFIGSNLCERYIHLGHSVTSIDNYFTGSVANHIEGVRYYNDDVRHINEIFKNEYFDLVFHLGEYSRVETSFDDVDIVMRNNSFGIIEVLEYCRKSGSKLMYAGSSTKYGDIGTFSSPYAYIKAKNSELVKNYGEWFGIDYAITYFYNVYGKREISSGKYATFIAKCEHAAKTGTEISIVMPGDQKRNFTHIDDIINGLILVAEKGYGDEYGIGSPDQYSVLEVAKMFGCNIKYIKKRKGNRTKSDLMTFKTLALGWEPKMNLKDYIDETRCMYA
jgi:UDP-glucose 4-epimerase